MKYKDYYKILGVKKEASQKDSTIILSTFPNSILKIKKHDPHQASPCSR